MSTATILIGPEHHGQRMSLEDFETAEAREGHLYELSRGVVTVIDVPGRRHLLPGLEFSCESIFRAAEVKKS